jgi:signal transduction histidine kinase
MSTTPSEKVIVIEDSLTFANMVTSTLKQEYGFEADIATRYADAEKLLSDNDYFAAIVDIDLPDAHKGEAVDLTIKHKVPTLVFTGTDDHKVQGDFWSKGIADYISKKGTYGLEYATWMINRLHHNPRVKVLLVDDSKSEIRVSKLIIELHQYNVFTAHSGEEALQVLADNPDIQICLMDCYMNGINGIQAAAKMRATHSREQLEIIGISSQSGQDISVQFIKSGANDFLHKPFLPEELLCRINHAAERLESYHKLKNLNELKNQMLGTAAHDIRGPIAAIKTAMELINKGTLSEEQKQSLMKMIQTNSNYSLELLENLLDVSAIESGKIELKLDDTNISELTEERIHIYESQANNKSITINGSIEIGIYKVVDATKIKEVVDNLITNAIKFSPSDSTIDISLKKDEEKIELRVTDSGSGIPEGEEDKLFAAFSTLSSRSTDGEKQTGLGLAIVKNIVDAHQGNIFCENQKEGGASFYVQLPH